MKTLKLIIRALYGATYLIAVILLIIGPSIVITHWGESGQADATDTSLMIFLLPVILTIIGEIMIFLSKRKRKQGGVSNLPLVFTSEWRYVAGFAVIVVIFVLIMFHQVGIQF